MRTSFFLGLTFGTFLIWLNFPNFPDELSEFCSTFLIFRMSFPNFPDELSEFCWTFLIFHPKIGEDLFFFFFLGPTPLPFLISGQLSEFFDYFPNFRLLSEFWFTFRILAENGPGTGCLGSHFFPTLKRKVPCFFVKSFCVTALALLQGCVYKNLQER